METFFSSLGFVTGSLLKVSGQASLLIGLVLLAQWLGRKHLPPRVRYALWLLVVARLMLPVSVESGFSIFNFTMAAPAKVFHAVGAASKASADKAGVQNAPAPAAAASPAPAPSAAAGNAASAIAIKSPVESNPGATRVPQRTPPASGRSLPWAAALSLVWLAGVLFLLGRIIWIPLRLGAQLARHETAPSPAVFALLEQSKRLIGVNQVLPIVQSRAVESPALLGFIRPWLLLPEGLVEKFTPQELRLVFLHELAHLKRRDIAVNWLATLLQILHWPNPLVWLALARMRADRELACDELALSFARAEENKTYGHAIIKLLEGFRRPAALPGLVGILEDQTQMQKRITMIAQFKKMTGWSTAAIGLVLGIGLVTLTDGQTEKVTTAKIFAPANAPAVKILLSGTSSDARGVLSPDETAVAYMHWVGEEGAEGGDLVVRDLRTGVSKTLAAWSRAKSNMEYPERPVWSADSKSIAYLWWTNNANECTLRIVARDGGEPKVISKDANFGLFDWSKDGKQLLGSLTGKKLRELNPATASGSWRLAVLDVERDAYHLIGPGVEHARFSPDARFVVCQQIVEGKRRVLLISADGAHVTPLTNGAWEDGTPAFSADGRLILLSSDRRGGWDLWGIPIDQGNVAGEAFPLRYDFGDYTKWITSSGKLAFRLSGSGVDDEKGARDVYEVTATQSPGNAEAQPRRISRGAFGRNLLPVWSPDGSMLAYTRPRTTGGRYPTLCIQSAGTEQLYDPRMGRITQLYWSPDGQTIAMQGWRRRDEGDSLAWGIYFFSVANHAPTTEHLADGSGRHWLGYSADGKELHYFDYSAGKRFAVTLATNMTREIPSSDEFAKVRPTLRGDPPYGTRPESWDDSSVVYVRQRTDSEQELVVADTDWKNPRVVARVTAPGNIEADEARLSPDRTKIAYVESFWPKSSAPGQLHVKAIDGSWERIVDTANKWPREFNWSPDSRRLAVELEEKLPSEIGVLENFLPPAKVAAK